MEADPAELDPITLVTGCRDYADLLWSPAPPSPTDKSLSLYLHTVREEIDEGRVEGARGERAGAVEDGAAVVERLADRGEVPREAGPPEGAHGVGRADHVSGIVFIFFTHSGDVQGAATPSSSQLRA